MCGLYLTCAPYAARLDCPDESCGVGITRAQAQQQDGQVDHTKWFCHNCSYVNGAHDGDQCAECAFPQGFEDGDYSGAEGSDDEGNGAAPAANSPAPIQQTHFEPSSMSLPDVQGELKRRGLDARGSAEDLCARLTEARRWNFVWSARAGIISSEPPEENDEDE